MMVLPLWLTIVLVGVAGALGALIRHAVTVSGRPDPATVRWRITAVNTVGSFFAGTLFALDSVFATVLAVGIFGALTTFSTIAVWLADDFRRRQGRSATVLLTTHLLGGGLAVVAGFVGVTLVL
jgi:CrcB protein